MKLIIRLLLSCWWFSCCSGFGLQPRLPNFNHRHNEIGMLQRQAPNQSRLMRGRNEERTSWNANPLVPLSMVDGDEVVVRDWAEEDFVEIQSLLSIDTSLFDPEGLLEVDIGSVAKIKESYDPNDGGCFFVATKNDKIRGTAGLIVGTQVQYLKSRASISSAGVTAAARRIICCDDDNDNDEMRRKSMLEALLQAIEGRAIQNGATNLILLAYPETSSTRTTTTSRPTSNLLETLGYEPLPVNLPGVAVEQYCKQLSTKLSPMTSVTDANVPASNKDALDSSASLSPSTMVLSSLVLTFLLVVVLGVANLLGLDVGTNGIDNNGIGTPLSTQELVRLQEDERLQRTGLDSGLNTERQWKDLNAEELREEQALMKIIQGENVRIQ